MGFFTFVLTICCVPGFAAGATVPRFALLSVVLPAFMVWHDMPIPRACLLVGAYLALMAYLSSGFYDAMAMYWQFCLLACVFCIGYAGINFRQVIIGGAIGLTINSIVVLGDGSLWHLPIVASAWSGGLFFNHAYAVEAGALVFAGVLCERMWWFIPGLLPTLWQGSRAPLVALGVVGVLFLWTRSRLLAIATFCIAVAAVFLLCLYRVDMFDTLLLRIGVWQDTISGLTFFGHGLGSFIYEAPLYQTHSNALEIRYDHPHLDLLQIAFELGVPGIALAGAFLAYLFSGLRTTAWVVLAVFVVEGFFSCPLYMPVTGFLAALAAGDLARCRNGLCWDFTPSRMGLFRRHAASAH